MFKTCKNPDDDPTALEVLVYHKRLGLLLLLCENSRLHMRTSGVASIQQRRMFRVDDNGMLDKPYINHPEVIN